MTNSTHYNLNLVEGTDLVNPLVQDVPNYEAIDAQMYANECASVGTAVELLTGTVHALTRTNTDTPVFRFTATADYEAGETFVVDGVQVTALLPSGEALGTGAYVIGSEVLCVLRDTRLTFFMAGGIQSVAADSEKLGGELPSYYGKATDVQTAQSTATAAGVLAQANASQIVEINDSLAKEVVINTNGFILTKVCGSVIINSSETFSSTTMASITIPLGYRPTMLVSFPCMYWNGNTYVIGYFNISSSGGMSLVNATGDSVTSSYIRLYANYPI